MQRALQETFGTRSSNDYYLDFYRGSFAKNNPLHMGCKYINSLPPHIKSTQNYNKFQKLVKNYLIELETYEFSDL